jgi:diphthine-ammonia ligase
MDLCRARSNISPFFIVIFKEQSGSLGLQPVFRSASWQQYEVEFISALHEFKQSGIEMGVFGDIDVDSHRESRFN